MRIHGGIFLVIWLLAFANQIKEDQNKSNPKEIVKIEFQEILRKNNLEGSILIFDQETDTYYSNDFIWSKEAFIPASTYKIPHTLIALELGIVDNAQSILKWDGVTRNVRTWNQDLTLKEAFHFSCVPCYQGIARQVGIDRMKEYLEKFDYGEIIFDAEEIDMFWLEGNSKISPFEQIDFLRKFEASELPIKARTESVAKELMIAGEGENYKLRAKTGLSLSGVGWYVGYLEKEGSNYFFATNLKMQEGVERNKRIEVTEEALTKLGILKDNH